MSGIATGPLQDTPQKLLGDWCALTPGFEVYYTDTDPELHRFTIAHLQKLGQTDPVACA